MNCVLFLNFCSFCDSNFETVTHFLLALETQSHYYFYHPITWSEHSSLEMIKPCEPFPPRLKAKDQLCKLSHAAQKLIGLCRKTSMIRCQ